MSIDIFSLKAIENISAALLEWKRKLNLGVNQVDDSLLEDITSDPRFAVRFVGYVAQQYTQKTKMGVKRAVAAYDKIMTRIPRTIEKYMVQALQKDAPPTVYKIGEIPSLHSLIPMSQTAHKAIFNLKAKDGVRGAHFNRVKTADTIFGQVADGLLRNIATLEGAKRG
jgi:hypothetical protein